MHPPGRRVGRIDNARQSHQQDQHEELLDKASRLSLFLAGLVHEHDRYHSQAPHENNLRNHHEPKKPTVKAFLEVLVLGALIRLIQCLQGGLGHQSGLDKLQLVREAHRY